MSLDQVKQIAPLWIAAWNNRDLDALMSYYSENCQFTSPIIEFLGIDKSGTIGGRDAIRSLMAKCFEDFVDLKFELVEVLDGENDYIMSYNSLDGLPAASVISLDEEGKINRDIVYVSTAYIKG